MSPVRSHIAGVLVVVPLASALLAGCSGDQPAEERADQGVVDGRYCGYVPTDVVGQYLGDEVTAHGDPIADRSTRSEGAMTCSINDSGSSLNIGVTVDEDHGVPPKDPPAMPAGCTRPNLPAAWGPARLCRTDYVRLTAWSPTDGRYLTADVDFEPGDAARASRTAMAIVQGVDASLDEYDADH